jgi:RNA polymerase sigma-70 factor (ECF subfamily)
MNVPDANLARWFAEEVQPHEADLRAYLRRAFPSLSDIDDLVQETYARIFRAKSAGRVCEARPYLFSVARNTACDVFRRSKIISVDRIAEIDRLSVVEDRPGVGDALAHEHEIEILREAIGVLPARCRQVLTLCKVYGLPRREVARQLGISEHTVNAQVALGVLRCRDFLRARGLMKEHVR